MDHARIFLDQHPAAPLIPGADGPAWRWNIAMAWLAHDQAVAGGVQHESPEANLFSGDAFLDDRLWPYLTGRDDAISPQLRRGFDQAINLWGRREEAFHDLPHLLEAGVLAERRHGDLLPEYEELDARVQRCYEATFFDVRRRLKDRDWLVEHVFRPMRQRTTAATWRYRAKVIAYGLDYDDYLSWADGQPSAKAQRLNVAMDKLARLLEGMIALRLTRADTRARLAHWLLRKADAVRRGEDEVGGEHDAPALDEIACKPARDWRERLDELRRRIPSGKVAQSSPVGDRHASVRAPVRQS